MAPERAAVTASDPTRRRVLGILLLYLILAGWFSMAVPPFESPDETYHYAFVRHVAGGNGLPVQSAVSTGPWEQEGSQAPLYYLLGGLLTAPVDQGDFPDLAVKNPRANVGDPLYPGNKNRMLYSSVQHPLRGANLALHLGRWLSIALGVVTIWFTYLTARLAFPRRPRPVLLAVGLVAFMPQFVFISASLNNDNAVTAMAAVTLFWLARLLVAAQDRAPRTWEWMVLGVLLGLAGLSKLQGLGLWLLAALAGLGIAWVRRDWRLPLVAALPVALPALLVAGWWYVRNLTLYGDLFGLSHLLSINGMRQDPLTWDGFWREFRGLRYSFWGLFGWFNILLPGWIYRVLDAMTLVALAGLVWGGLRLAARRALRFRQNPALRVWGLLGLWALLSLALLLYWTAQATGSQGRLIFPGLTAFAILLAGGLEIWLRMMPAGLRRPMAALPPLFLLGASFYAVAILIPQAYQPAPPVTDLPATARPADLRYDDGRLQLLGVEMPAGPYHPGDWVPVTLYLRSSDRLAEDLQLFVQLLDDRREILGNVTTHAGWGRNPTSLWEPGALYADRYLVQIEQPVAPGEPLLAQLYVGFIDPDPGQAGNDDALPPLDAFDGAGNEVTPFVGQVAITPHSTPTAVDLNLQPLDVTFGPAVALRGSAYPEVLPAGAEMLPVTLLWEATGAPAEALTTYVHLLDEAGARVAGFDRPPGGERYPTQVWREGDRVVGEMPVALPPDLAPGDYQLWLGLYPSASQGATRLPPGAADGRTVQDNQLLLGPVQIEPAP